MPIFNQPANRTYSKSVSTAVKIRTTALTALLLSAGFVTNAGATVLTGSSTGSGEQTSLTLVALAGGAVTMITSGPLPSATGTAPAAYNVTGTAASASAAGILSTGILNVSAASTATGLPGSAATQAASTVNGLGLSLASLLGISATTISTSAAISGDYGSLADSGSTTITGLSIAGLGAFGATITPSVNDIVLNAAGIEVELNKQVASTLAGSASIIVQGLVVDFNSVLATVNGTLGYLSGSIVIASSQASESAGPTAVAEPSGLLMLATGLAGLVFVRRRRMMGF